LTGLGQRARQATLIAVILVVVGATIGLPTDD
jgi:hypothetical protein